MRHAAEVLIGLPEVFTMADFQRATEHSLPVAQVTLSRLSQRGWVKNAGERTGVYFNTFKDRQAHEKYLLEAVKRVYPSAVVIGPQCLHAHGWTTQIPQEFDVAVLSTKTTKRFHGVNIVDRPSHWYQKLVEEKQLLRADRSPFPIESVTPAFALWDARKHKDVWVPDPDDLDLPDDGELEHPSF